jgi:hypothetical protein
MTEIEDRMRRLETRVAALDDQVQLYQLMSSYGPLVDGGDAEGAAALWVEDGVYDWGGGEMARASGKVTEGAEGAAFGRDAIADMVRGAYHQRIIHEGAGHVLGLPHVVLDGDTATAISYSRLYRYDGENFRVWRVAANRWEFARTPQGWRVERRVNRVLNGAEEARALLRSGVAAAE